MKQIKIFENTNRAIPSLHYRGHCMKNYFLVVFTGIIVLACSPSEIRYEPAIQKLPQHIKKIYVKPFENKTQYLVPSEKITLQVIDEFLKNGEYAVVPEPESQGVVIGEIIHYILTPVQYNANLVPTVYKLNVIVSVKFLDKNNNQYLWEEPALQSTKLYSAPTLPGGMTEEQARESLWEVLAKDIVKRTVEGFGSATSTSQKKIPKVSE